MMQMRCFLVFLFSCFLAFLFVCCWGGAGGAGVAAPALG